MTDTETAPTTPAGFRRFRVVAKTPESRTITSFHLEPVDAGAWRPFDPGQFLVFKIPVADERGHVIRNYSVSSAPSQAGSYRITVKREAAPDPAFPHGLGSSHLHDIIAVGDIVLAEGPRGAFTLDRASTRPVVLLSGGVGLTPLVSMLHALAVESDRRVYFIHACDSGDVHALDAEVQAATGSRPGIATRIIYRVPTEQDRAAGRHHYEGFITRQVLQETLPLDDYDIYMCGPPPFMQAVYPTLRSLGVSKHRIAYEFFGPATVLDTEAEPAPVVVAAPNAPALPAVASTADAVMVTFKKSGKQAVWTGHARSLLEFAEDEGLNPPFSCRSGVCSTCSTRLLEGQVTYTEEPLDEPEPGEALICCCKPAGSVVLDL